MWCIYIHVRGEESIKTKYEGTRDISTSWVKKHVIGHTPSFTQRQQGDTENFKKQSKKIKFAFYKEDSCTMERDSNGAFSNPDS